MKPLSDFFLLKNIFPYKMDVNKLTTAVEAPAKTADILKPISEIANIISNEYLKKIELNEYCRIMESNLGEFQNKIQAVASAKNESARIKAEYKSRNKMNITNSKSFRQALNELHKYKAELKSCYLATEKALKFKKIKYKKIISAYSSAWEEAVKKYNSDPVFVELLEIQEGNTLLEKEIEKKEKLRASLEIEFAQLKENIEKEFFKKIVEFSKAIMDHKEYLNSQNRIKEKELIKAQNSERSLEFRVFRANVSPFEKNSFNSDNNDETNTTCNVDVSIFDDIMVPSENLESQNLEEDGYSFIQNEGKHFDISKDQDDDLEFFNDYQQKMELQNKESANPKGDSVQDSLKSAVAEENESQYFKQQTLEPQAEDVQPTDRRNLIEEGFNKQRHIEQKLDNNLNDGKRIVNSVNNKSASSVEQMENEDVVQMECEESVSEGSFANHRESYECKYQKSSSVSSDELISNGDNQNESAGPFYKSCGDEQNNCLKPNCETEKNDYKSFTGFFTMGNEHDAPTPSIFKLF